MPAEPSTKTCPICWDTFTTAANNPRHTYCSERCRKAASTRRRRAETGHASQAAPPAHVPASAPLPQPAAHRDCPHCGEPITIVALLTTPEAARPQLPAAASDGVVPLRRETR